MRDWPLVNHGARTNSVYLEILGLGTNISYCIFAFVHSRMQKRQVENKVQYNMKKERYYRWVGERT